jgi:hypothetical protein
MHADVDVPMLLRARAADASGASVVWTIGLRKPLLEEEEDDGEELSKDALAGRASARAAMLESDAAITLKFARAHAAALEQCIVPLIFKHNPVRLPACSPHMHAHAHDVDSPSACVRFRRRCVRRLCRRTSRC